MSRYAPMSPSENLALGLIFQWLGERQVNRTSAEYAAIAKRLPKDEVLFVELNRLLKELHAKKLVPLQICDFRAHDLYVWYRPYPSSLSLTTIANALVKSGMRDMQRGTLKVTADGSLVLSA